MGNPQLNQFLNQISKSIQNDTFVSLSFMNKRNKEDELKTVHAKLIETKKGLLMSFVFRYQTNDITKNKNIDQLNDLLDNLLSNHFTQSILCTTKSEWHLSQKASKKWKLLNKEILYDGLLSKTHDKQKNRLISSTNNHYLHGLDITSADGHVKNNRQDKYRQINKFVEIINKLIEKKPISSPFKIVDMGAGKGYLSFALYDHLSNNLKLEITLEAIEMRNHLVRNGNDLARKVGFEGLSFKEGTIENTPLHDVNMIIALHACDTATDDAIYRGIKSGAQMIICSPCCHKQIRKQMEARDPMSSITKYGILKERQAEIVTDTIRTLILEAYGYETKIMEFIATSHTPKNLLITAVKKQNKDISSSIYFNQIDALKKQFGIEYHQLEKLTRSLVLDS